MLGGKKPLLTRTMMEIKGLRISISIFLRQKLWKWNWVFLVV